MTRISSILICCCLWVLVGISSAGAQVTPDRLKEDLISKSVSEVLKNPGELTWHRVPMSDESKKRITPELKQIRHLPDTLYIGKVTASGRQHWLIPDIAPSKSETFTFLLYLDSEKAIVDVDILSYRESYGYEIDYSFFRKQFHGKRKPGELRFGRTIQNISGATISARSITREVHDLIVILQHVNLP